MQVRQNHFSKIEPEITQVKQSNGVLYSVRGDRKRYFFPDEWVQFYTYLKSKKAIITFTFLINTGARISEIEKLKVSDVDLERKSMLFRKTKTGNSRAISLSSQFTKYLVNIINKYHLSPSDHFPILSRPASHICMKKTLREAGFKDWMAFSLHNVRKTHETWLLALDIDSLKVAKRVGHSITVAQRFYVSSDTFDYEDKKTIRIILGDLFEAKRL